MNADRCLQGIVICNFLDNRFIWCKRVFKQHKWNKGMIYRWNTRVVHQVCITQMQCMPSMRWCFAYMLHESTQKVLKKLVVEKRYWELIDFPYIKDQKCRGCRSTVDAEAINDQHREVITSVDPWGGSTIDMERVNSQLSLSHEKAVISVDSGGGGADWERIFGRGVCCPVFNAFGILMFWLLIVLIYNDTPLTWPVLGKVLLTSRKDEPTIYGGF